jgi:hypothetical protein
VKDITKLIALALMGLGVVIMAIGVVNWQRAAEGLESLQAVYEAQNVTLSYNDDGQLIDRGTTEGADAIMALLTEDWKYPVNEAHFDPNDPLVNTPTELMYQYATVAYHVLHGTQTVELTEAVEYNGEVFEPGVYEVDVDGRYWTDFDRMHPLDGQVREMAWTGTVHGLLGSIAAGVNADYQAGFAHFAAWRTLLIGFTIALGGVGLFALARRQDGMEAVSAETAAQEKVKTNV